MNRHEKRAEKKLNRNLIFIDHGRLLERDQNYGQPVVCYVCGTSHRADGLARIRSRQETVDVPLCARCWDDSDAVGRKFLNAPQMKIIKGGDATTEQVLALAEKQDASEQ
jgi:hypothetical protein